MDIERAFPLYIVQQLTTYCILKLSKSTKKKKTSVKLVIFLSYAYFMGILSLSVLDLVSCIMSWAAQKEGHKLEKHLQQNCMG